jgi:hypothetical protein
MSLDQADYHNFVLIGLLQQKEQKRGGSNKKFFIFLTVSHHEIRSTQIINNDTTTDMVRVEKKISSGRVCCRDYLSYVHERKI